MKKPVAAEKLSGALSMIDDEYIAEAGSHTVRDRDRGFFRWAAVAVAVIAVFVTAVPILIHTGVIKIGNTPSTPSADDEIVALMLRITEPAVSSGDIDYKESEYAPFRDINETWTDESAPKKKTVTFDGRKYNGEYVRTERVLYWPYTEHLYSFTDEDGEEGAFRVNAETGEFYALSYDYPDHPDDPWDDSESMTFEECEKDAARIAKQYLDYQYCESRGAAPTAARKNYEYTFYEADHADTVGVGASVKVCYSGYLGGRFRSIEIHSSLGNGSPDITEAVDVLTGNDAQAIVGDKLKRIFETEKTIFGDEKIDSYDVTSMTAVRLDSSGGRESVGVVYACYVHSVLDDGDKTYEGLYNIEILVKFNDTEGSERNSFLSNPGNFTALAISEYSASDPQPADYSDCEYEPWQKVDKTWTDGDAPEKLSITFDGEEYSGTYKYTTRPLYSPYNVRVYYFRSGKGVNGDFSVNERTGELDEIVFDRSEVGVVNSATLESCENDAVRIAGQYLDKLTFKSEMWSQPYKRFVYTFYTVDKIYGIQYSTSVTVMFNGDGELVRFTKNAMGAIGASDADDIEALTGSGARAAADKKIKEMFGDTFLESSFRSQCGVPLDEGGVGVVYFYYVTVKADAPGSWTPYTDEVYVYILVKIK